MRDSTTSLLLTAALLLPACSSDDGGAGGGDCPFPEECASDVTGNWEIAFGCPLGGVLESEDCPGWTCEIEAVAATGYLSFIADGTAEIDWSSTADVRCAIPLGCLEGLTCGEAATEYGHFDCTEAGDACDCVQTDEDGDQLSGTWEIGEYDILTITGDEGEQWMTSNYCVEGNHLAIKILHSLDLEIPGEFTAFADAQLVAQAPLD